MVIVCRIKYREKLYHEKLDAAEEAVRKKEEAEAERKRKLEALRNTVSKRVCL